MFGDFVAGDEPLPEEQVEVSLRSQALARRARRRCRDRERQVLVLRYGLVDEEPKTLEEIGKRLGLTRERVRQIELESLRRLAGLREMQMPSPSRLELRATRRAGSSSRSGAAVRSSRSARDSSWRTRSRVMPSPAPTSSSVCGVSPSRPKRSASTRRMRGFELRERVGELLRAQHFARSSPRAASEFTSSIRSP